MDHIQVQEIATKNKLGKVYFQFNPTHPNNALIEVGYISVGSKRVLFCKRGSNTNPDQFYLCNEYRKLDSK